MEQCNKNARQNVMLGEPPAIIDNPRGVGGPGFGGAAGASMDGVTGLACELARLPPHRGNHGQANAKGG